MSILLLADSPETLADRLADDIEGQARGGDIFAPARIVVPNPYIGKWLRLHIARRHGIAINLRQSYLETILWDMLRAVDPREHKVVPELLNAETYRLMVLAVLLGDEDPNLASLRRYFNGDNDPHSRRAWRRAWHLADKLGKLIRDYEYHRQQAFIQPWIKKKLVFGKNGGDKSRRSPLREFEKGQYTVFDHIIREPQGKRALLNEKTGKNYKTLPQYAMEVREILDFRLKNADLNLHSKFLNLKSDPIHLFGLAQISALHVHTLHWLGHFFDLRLYHLNPLTVQLPEQVSGQNIRELAEKFCVREGADTGLKKPRRSPEEELLESWACAGAESLRLMTELLQDDPLGSAPMFSVARIPTQSVKTHEKVLQRLQGQLLGKVDANAKQSQDTSLQIVGCPGALREVETVYHSILHNLQTDPKLKQTDVAVLVTDMNKYRPLIQSVFDRPSRRIGYNLMDYAAVGLSMYGHGLLGLLDLALESFTRTRVLEVLLNPCFLARLGVDHAQALTWVGWAKELGIYQGWDAQEKSERGYAPSPLYGWRLGLQRLRLGRFMETQAEPGGGPAPRFGNVLPFADLDSQDREQLDAFTRAVDGLLPTLHRLRDKKLTGRAWADMLRQLLQSFLAIPADRPEEAQVRDQLLAALDLLPLWDNLETPPLPLSLIREFIHGHLETIEGRHGEYLAGGVTIAPLAAVGPVPFSIIYVLGLGEELFPGGNALPSFDLRGHGRSPGDIRPAEKARYHFLETLLAAKDKIYLFYNNKDVQKDRVLLPAVPLVQLQRFLNKQILDKDYKCAEMRLHDHDPESLTKTSPATVDAGSIVDETDRLLALLQIREEKPGLLNKKQNAELAERLRRHQPDFTMPISTGARPEVPSLTIKELKEFLKNPAKAALRKHLYLKDEEEDDQDQDDEPFVSPRLTAHRLAIQVLHNLIHDTAKSSLSQALRAWPDYFNMLYEEEGLRCHVPENSFGTADQAYLRADLESRITDTLEDFLQRLDPSSFCGPVLLGTSPTPIGAQRHFPALTLTLPHAVPQRPVTQVNINGFLPLVWANANNLAILVLTNKAKLDKPKVLSDCLFEPVLFYLALLANTDAFPDKISSRDWVKGGTFTAHISTRGDLQSYVYKFSEEEAVDYLCNLAVDYLDPTAFDLLPFDVFAGEGKNEWDLSAAYVWPDDKLKMPPDKYHELLEDKIEDALESTRDNYWHSPLLDLAKAAIPDDALAKVRKRFRLLDRGPAGQREK